MFFETSKIVDILWLSLLCLCEFIYRSFSHSFLGVFSISSKKITFYIPDWMYDGLKARLSVLNDSYRIDDFFKAAAINRFIQLGYLDEFGQPIPLPHLDFSVSSFPGWSELNKTFDNSIFKMSDIRSVASDIKEE